MRKTRTPIVAALLAIVSLAAGGCGDGAVAPTQPAAQVAEDASELLGTVGTVTGLLGSALGNAQTVEMLDRGFTLNRSIRVSRDIGTLGGVIAIPEAGLRVVFPAGSVPVRPGRTVRISVTALPGRYVAYEFAPHGLKFLVPPVVWQDLSSSKPFLSRSALELLEGAYFPSSSGLDDRNGTALVTELRPTVIVADTWAVFPIQHFSGYLVATGRQSAR